VNLQHFKNDGGFGQYSDSDKVSEAETSNSDSEVYGVSPRSNSNKNTKSDLLNNLKKNLRYFSKNPNITWDIVEKNPHIQWMYYYIFSNKNMSIAQLKQICLKYKKPPTKTKHMFFSCGMDEEYADDYTQKELIFDIEDYIFHNPNITEEFLDWCMKEKIKIDYYNLSDNPAISLDYIIRNPCRGWDYRNLSSNPNLTIQYIEKYSDIIDWELKKIVKNKFTFNPVVYWKRTTEYINLANFIISDLKTVICNYL
jgi:hypothetical protein